MFLFRDRSPKCGQCGSKLEVFMRDRDAVVYDGIECRRCGKYMCLSCATETADRRKGRCGWCGGETKGASTGV